VSGSPQDDFFESRIRPVLVKNCYGCHAAAKMGGLQLDSREHLLRVVVPGDPAKSKLLLAVSYNDPKLKMPPSGRLSAQEIDNLTTWIKGGAVWAAGGQTLPTQYSITNEQRSFWAFQPVANVQPPVPQNPKWARTEIDRFILAKLEAKRLKPAPPVDRRMLIRRAYFDLIGLPPTAEEVEAFVADRSTGAFAKLVDRLLASPRYGERWGRYWLDVARYSDDKLSSGEAEPYPNAFRYRDWVIQAFNDDMPYNQFAMAQIAGDKMENPEKYRAGLGFYALSPEFQDDRVDATTRGFLALTVACAQCHDHKYDPVPTKDYYSLLGIFNNTHLDEFPMAPKETVEAWASQKKKILAKDKERREFVETQSAQLARILATQTAEYMLAVAGDQDGSKLDAPTLARWKSYLGKPRLDHPYLEAWRAAKTPTDRRREAEGFRALLLAVDAEKRGVDDHNHITLGATPSSNDLSQANLEALPRDKFVLWEDTFGGLLNYGEKDLLGYLSGEWKSHLDHIHAELEALRKALPTQYPYLQVIQDNAQLSDQRVWLRGSRYSPGEPAPPHFVTILSPGEPKLFDPSRQRLELAQALIDPANPMIARVIVNRIWQHHFGEGIVRTASNFGLMGDRPANPELLDFLATRFVQEGWSVKKLHREIMLSSVYAESDRALPEATRLDPENRLLSHANLRRLDAEAIRDQILFSAGTLDLTAGGKPAPLDLENHRRTVYGFVSRHKLDPYLSLFDYPVPNATSEARNLTNVPMQRLFFMNSLFVLGESKSLAARDHSIEALYRRLFQRAPTPKEKQFGLDFLSQSEQNWPQYAQVLMCSNEFLFVE
jgi:hypothetical protein